VFVSRWLDGAPPGANLVAILPEVLRTGSRYGAWRRDVTLRCKISSLASLGQFDTDTDVDVFVISARKPATGTHNYRWWPEPPHLGVNGDISVAAGTVVPHRDPVEGPRLPFLHASNLPHAKVAATPMETRRYTGPVFTPPFVAVRRTSRPGQWPRAHATVVTGDDPVAVENHLIILKPASADLANCSAIVNVLHSTETSRWLDARLGGRHLTTKALKELLRGPISG